MMTLPPEPVCAMALTRVKGLSFAAALQVYQAAGSATALFAARGDLRAFLPDVHPRVAAAMRQSDDALLRAEAEWELCQREGIGVSCLNDEGYPARLRNCPDAPLVLFHKEASCLSERHVVAVVGTRHVTEQGKDTVRRLCAKLAETVPDVVVVSGLAYGVDIQAHRGALAEGLRTVAVLAHGFDRIYPAVHRTTAVEMLTRGGLVTEYMTGTVPDKGNFVRRNRIVAGLVDACVVVESASKGGALITARLAGEYDRDVFAFPGRVTDPYSEGCNRLIASNQAQLLTCGGALAEAMGWTVKKEKGKPVQRELFAELTEEEAALCRLLNGTDGVQLNMLAVRSGIPVQRVSNIMFDLEMRGIVRMIPGSIYRLV